MVDSGDMSDQRPICLLLCALGGEGGGVLSDWLIATAHRAGYAAQKTSIPGVAQRTGATTYYVEVFPVPIAHLGGRKPVFSLYPVPGMVDALISSELLETARQTSIGMTDSDHTIVVSSSARALTTAERIRMGDGRLDSAKLIEIVSANSRELHLLDMTRLAQEAGTVVSAVMLGAIAGCGVLPFEVADYEAILSDGTNSNLVNLKGFSRALQEIAKARDLGVARMQSPATLNPQSASALPEAARSRFPAPVQTMLALGYARVLDFQDHAYAELYLRRMEQVLQAERTIDPTGQQNFATTREMARWLALWMAFDDVVRVADLKSRANRRLRLRKEIKANAKDVVKVYDYLHPGVAEIAGLLPATIAKPLLRHDTARRQRGLSSWSLPLVLGSHTVLGALALRAISSLRWLRRRSYRYASEQAFIERWVEAVRLLTGEDWQCGYEMALCGRLIKGYGVANERGKENLSSVLSQFGQLPHRNAAPAHAKAIGHAREAALADDGGKTLDKVLQSYGAPARPPKTAPIHFVKRARAPST